MFYSKSQAKAGILKRLGPVGLPLSNAASFATIYLCYDTLTVGDALMHEAGGQNVHRMPNWSVLLRRYTYRQHQSGDSHGAVGMINPAR